MENVDWDGQGVSTDTEYQLVWETGKLKRKIKKSVLQNKGITNCSLQHDKACAKCSLFPAVYQELELELQVRTGQ
mgnify:FL=1